MPRADRSKLLWGGAALAALVLAPWVATDSYQMHLLIMVGIFGILAVSLNLVTGYTGLLSMAHGAFFAIGAYAEALSANHFGLPFWGAVVVAGLVCAVFGVALGLPSLKVRDVYFAVITLCFGLIANLVFINWVGLTGGPQGISGIARPAIGGFVFSSRESYYYLVLAAAAFTVWSCRQIVHSRFGRAFIAIRENEAAATSLGVNTSVFKLLAFSLSAAYAGLAGSLYGPYVRYINPDAFGMGISINALVMVVIGGLGNVYGALLGAAVVYVLPELLRFARVYYFAIYGLLVIVVMIFLPAGLISLPELLRGRRGPTGREVSRAR